VSVDDVRWWFVLIVACMVASQSASAESVTVQSLEELVIPAAVIARVTIVGERADRTWTWPTSYRRVAFAQVTDPLKGVVRDYQAMWWTTGTMSIRADRVTVHDLFPQGAAYQTIRDRVAQLSATAARRH
jgi:hypothetical protein